MSGILIGCIVGAIVLIFIVAAIVIHNGMVKARNDVQQAFADIDVFLKKRYDLIPNLVNTVKGYAKHEKETFNQITELRGQAVNTNNMNQAIETNNKISASLRNMLALAENYPSLKADKNFLALQNSLSDIEREIASVRVSYNNYATIYNTKLETFPNNLFALIFGFKKSNLFAITDKKERENVKVEF